MKVAVIGGGFSGLLAAYLMEKEGVSVTLYEKQEALGGHCHSLVTKTQCIELGTVFCLNDGIKELFVALDIAFSERLTYRNFVNEDFFSIEQLSREHIHPLISELLTLKKIVEMYPESFDTIDYGLIHEDLKSDMLTFLHQHNLTIIPKVIASHLSSFGFGAIDEVPAFYGLSVFNVPIINAFIRGEKLLFLDQGFSEVISQLAKNISHIRYATEVTGIGNRGTTVEVETIYGSDQYDKVLIATTLGENVIKDRHLNQVMSKLITNAYFSCAFEVEGKNMATTYYTAHSGLKNKIQFFHTFKKNNKTILLAYAYGTINKELVHQVQQDIEHIGIHVNHLITAKQWHIFPHLNGEDLTPSFYQELVKPQGNENIYLIGSLVTKPSISSLHKSIKERIRRIL